MKSIYKVIFFDLDHTLWDYKRNSKMTLEGLYHKHLNVNNRFDYFYSRFDTINEHLWNLYHQGKINRDDIRVKRFRTLLGEMGIKNDLLAKTISEEYLMTCPLQPHLMPGAREVLEELRNNYKLYVITNGFEDIQYIKIRSAGISHFFDQVITSDGVGYKKPAPEIFQHALQLAGVDHREALMIGDNLETDIKGANNANVDTVFFNPDKTPHEVFTKYEIEHLSEIFKILNTSTG
ncbi:MAG: YjjG family noncanonical pyrimidine nucleotidase [Cyclobacteriaceae bacterium]|nr:YjjG family noncanonical pyrimidine nucleotidase [Cyclobacteriaceae bacterium]